MKYSKDVFNRSSKAQYGFLKDHEKQVSCAQCMDQRYITEPVMDFAVARRCKACIDDCEVCAGEGFTFEARDNGYRFVKACSICNNIESRIANFNKARLPARYHDKTFENFSSYHNNNPNAPIGNLPRVMGHVYTRASNIYKVGEKGILLLGKVGTGKTHLLAALIRQLTLEKGFVCRFIEFSHLLSELRTAYERKTNANALLTQLADVPVLAIDELGKGRNNDWQISIIDELISKRYNRGLTTFCTTNYPLSAAAIKPGSVDTESAGFKMKLEQKVLTDMIGDRIVSRLCEMMDVVEIKDVPDYRQRSFHSVI